MPITDNQITECHDRYIREQDRYVKMADVTYEKCIDIVQKKLTVRATVQRRAKNPKSFMDKLKKAEIRNKYTSVNEIFENISDLAGVRIATYRESDREAVVAEIIKEFVGKDNGRPTVEVKDKFDQGKHYRATHCQVYLPEEDLSGANENLKETTCEIQVCSLLAHVFNEIEHDLQYKPLSGSLSETEKQFIDQLGLLTKAGDITIKRLLQETDARLKERTGQFDDVYDFVARMRELLHLEAAFSANAGQLFDELTTLGLRTPEAIAQEVAGGDQQQIAQVAKTEYEKLKKYCEKQQVSILEDNSSDILLVGVLKTRVENVLTNHPAGRGLGRPSRLGLIARYYKQMIDAPNE